MNTFDIVIIGGGLIGTSLALSLRKSPWRVALVESYLPAQHSQSQQDMRSLVLSYASQLFFEEQQLWEKIRAHGTSIHKIHVSEKGRFGKTLLDAEELGLPAFGTVVPIPLLYQTLQAELEGCKSITLFRPAKLSAFESSDPFHWNLTLETPSSSSPQHIKTTLLIAADGDHSLIREKLKWPYEKIDYQQTAIVTTAQISKLHSNIAYERFTPHGVLAILPRMQNQVAIIWTVDNQNVEKIKAELLSLTQQCMGYKLGKLSNIGMIQTNPLKFIHAEKQAMPSGVMLLGNAAHVLHPVAAQGLNLGLRDVSDLSTLLSQEKTNLAKPALLETYLKDRENDQASTEKFTQRLIDTFTPQNPIFSHLRSAGLFVFDFIPPLKRAFCLKRMGVA